MNTLFLFGSKGCAACFELKKNLKNLDIDHVYIDVGNDEGGALASRWQVKSLPTMIIFDENKQPIRSLIGVQNDYGLRQLRDKYGLTTKTQISIFD